MHLFKLKNKIILIGMLMSSVEFCCMPVRKRRKKDARRCDDRGKRFVSKDCLSCHKKFSEKYLGMKDVHLPVKEKKCEDCHLRHGLVPKLILKKEGNEICYPCHSKDKIGTNKANVHTALKRGKCIQCHNPHASQFGHLLKAEGMKLAFNVTRRRIMKRKSSTKWGLKVHDLSLFPQFDQKGLLVKAETPLCLGCHDSSKASFKKGHENYPVNQASCTICHNPHSSLQANF